MGIPMHFAVLFDFQAGSAHIGEAFRSFVNVRLTGIMDGETTGEMVEA